VVCLCAIGIINAGSRLFLFLAVSSEPGPAVPATGWIGAIAGSLLFGAIAAYCRWSEVRKACQALDPSESWTERCPTAVLICCVWLVERAASELCGIAGSLSSPSGVASRASALALILVLSLLGAAASVGIYKMSRLIWTLSLAFYLVACFFGYVQAGAVARAGIGRDAGAGRGPAQVGWVGWRGARLSPARWEALIADSFRLPWWVRDASMDDAGTNSNPGGRPFTLRNPMGGTFDPGEGLPAEPGPPPLVTFGPSARAIRIAQTLFWQSVLGTAVGLGLLAWARSCFHPAVESR
jgi:hypothetical protein